MPLALLGLLVGRGRTFSELCDALGTDARHLVSYHLDRLRQDALIECHPGATASSYEVTESGRQFVETMESLSQ